MESHSIELDYNKCVGCVVCMKACPAKAIRIRDNKAKIISELCIDCGECLRICPYRAIKPIIPRRSDKKYKYRIATVPPVMYGQFGKDVSPNDILLAILKTGFDYVEDNAWYCEMATVAIEEYLDDYNGPKPIISNTCPSVVRLIIKNYPQLCKQISPINVPREVGAYMVRERIAKKKNLNKDDIGIFHIVPCTARVVSVLRPVGVEESEIDEVISIEDIYKDIYNILKKTTFEDEKILHNSSGVGIGWAISGGEVQGLTRYNSLSVSGVQDVMNILSDVENGRLKDIDFLECMICPGGCVSGSLTIENRHIATSIISALVRMYGVLPRVNRKMVHELLKKDFFFIKDGISGKMTGQLSGELKESIEKMTLIEEIKNELPGKLCGVCGAPDCETLAEDIVEGRAKKSDCIFLQRKEINFKDVISEFDANLLAGNPDKKVTGCYASDLLSNVIANAKTGSVWVTMQMHENIIAVAVLKELSGIIISGSKNPPQETIDSANKEGVALIVVNQPVFDIISKLIKMGVKNE